MFGSIGLPELIILAVLGFALFGIIRAIRRGNGLILLGLAAGAIVGFLLRPSITLVGQLPLGVVLTRGATLKGLDVMLKPFAETSFNYIIVGALIGLGAGIAISRIGRSTPQAPSTITSISEATDHPVVGDVFRYCSKCGAALTASANFCGSCGNKVS